MDQEFDKMMMEIHEALGENLLDLLFRLERLEELSGLTTATGRWRRLMPLGSSEENSIALNEIKRRIEILEEYVDG